MVKRVVTGVVALAITLVCLMWSEPWGVWGLVLGVFVLGAIEIVRLTGSNFLWPATIGSLLLAGWLLSPDSGIPGISFVCWIIGAYGLLVWLPNEKSSSVRLSVWLGAGCLGALALGSMKTGDTPLGSTSALLIALLPLWVGDSLAYFVGSKFGKHKMAPALSPNKSWEGAVANLAGCLSTSWLAVSFVGGTPLLGVALGLATGIFGQVGDLLQSRVKRLAEVKDSGSILPGHGGVLDRLDSFLFSSVPALLAIYWIEPSVFHVKHWPY